MNVVSWLEVIMKKSYWHLCVNRLLVISLLVVVVLAAQNSGAIAADKIAIPVFFATDRTLDANGGTDLNYSDLQLTERKLNYGVKNIVLVGSNIDGDVSERATGLGWWTPLAAAVNEPVQHTMNQTLTEQEFFNRVKASVEDGDSKRPLVLFVHGCCQPFKSSMEGAAKLELALQAPVILYAWSSMPPTEKLYRENEIRQRNGSEAFYDFLKKLEAVVPPDRTVVIAHSMGNRFVHESLKTRHWERGSNPNCPKYRAVILACADVNVDDFASDEKHVTFSCKKLAVTKNDTDLALLMSKLQRGYYGRLGAPGSALNKLLNKGDAEIYDIVSIYRNKHDLPVPVLVDIVRGDEGGFQQQNRFFQKKPHLFEVRN